MKKIGYMKIGRSMPLTLAKCGNLGGDVEMVAVVKELALRHPDDYFYLLGRNSGERPTDVGLPPNVLNPWVEWAPEVRRRTAPIRDKYAINPNGSNLSIEGQLALTEVFDDITRDAFVGMDAHVVWLGQHGTSNTPIPRVDDRSQLTKPQDWCAYYSSFILRGVNAWRDVDPWNREEIYLNADARNVHKMRDLRWPLRHPTLAQRNESKRIKHERYASSGDLEKDAFRKWHDQARTVANFDTTAHRHWENLGYTDGGEVWTSVAQSVYSRLEVNGLAPGTPFGDLIKYDETWDRPGDFGMFINEARAIGIRPELSRRAVLEKWVLPLSPHFIHGTWSKKSQEELGISVSPAPWSEYYPKLHSVRCTFTTPSSGSGWATAKPWEAFAGGTVCFFHPDYDDQDNILGDADPALRKWLRVKTPRELKMRVDNLRSDASAWTWIVRAQRQHFDAAMSERRYLRLIEERIYDHGNA